MSEELIEEIPAEESVEEIAGEYPEITRRYKAGEELTDEELDTIADVAISIVRDLLGFFDAANSPIDEYEGDEGELILDITAPDLAVLIGRHGRTQGRTVNLPPMSAYERRLVHIALRDDARIDTHSEGTDPERRVVITVR